MLLHVAAGQPRPRCDWRQAYNAGLHVPQCGSYRDHMRNERHDEPLSGEELEVFLQFLHRFARDELDLFALMEVGDAKHPAYVSFGRDPQPGVEPSAVAQLGEGSDIHR